VREFVLGVLIVPSLLSFSWLSVFGGSALFQELGGLVDLQAAVSEGPEVAMFRSLAGAPLDSLWGLPIAWLTSLVAIFLVVIFFVTSSDSGSLVVDHLTSGGKLDPPIPQRVFWAVLEGVVAAVLLIGGGEQGLTALQTAAITTGLPFSVVLLLMCFSLNRGLNAEYAELEASRLQGSEAPSGPQRAPSTAQAYRE